MIYVITSGEYSDYHICAVATTEERAEELCRMYSFGYDTAEIETYEENVPGYDWYNPEPTLYWRVSFKENGESNIPEQYYDRPNLQITVNQTNYVYPNHLTVSNIIADTEQEAFKIACDHRAKYLAEKFGF